MWPIGAAPMLCAGVIKIASKAELAAESPAAGFLVGLDTLQLV
jgi:hypothetical protein